MMQLKYSNALSLCNKCNLQQTFICSIIIRLTNARRSLIIMITYAPLKYACFRRK